MAKPRDPFLWLGVLAIVVIASAFFTTFPPFSAHVSEKNPWADFWVANGTIWLFIGTGLLASVTYSLVRDTRASILQAKEDARLDREHARDLLTTERRPWIDVRAISSEVLPVGGGGQLTVTYQVVNVGLSPAVNVRVRMGHIEPEKTIAHAQERLRGAMANAKPQPGVFARSHFPGDGREVSGTADLGAAGRAGHAVFVGGWAEYQFAEDDDLHLTPFVLELAFTVNPATGAVVQDRVPPLMINLAPT